MAIPKRVEFAIPATLYAYVSYYYGGSKYYVETPSGAIYFIFRNTNSYLSYVKSTDYGYSWGNRVDIAGTTLCYCSAVWYDRWSGINGDLIHVAILDTNSDIIYYNIDTANNDTISSKYTIFNGTSLAAGSYFSITRTVGGNLICGGCIDAGAELFCYKSVDIGINWTSIAAVAEATTDQLILQPNLTSADTNDAICIFWDASANEISRKLYDDSANSWAETLVAASMTDVVATVTGPHFSATPDLTNSQIVLVAWSAVDTANADLRCWKITEAAITEVTNVILNSGDDQGCCSISIDTVTGYWYVFYFGSLWGWAVWPTSVPCYYKVSTDQGSTWSEETDINAELRSVLSMTGCPRIYKSLIIFIYNNYNGSNYPQQYIINKIFAIGSADYTIGF